MKFFSCLIISILFLVIYSCKKENDDISFIKKSSQNSPPGLFTVKVLTVSYNQATIEWEPATDPDQDTLFYAVYFQDSVIAQNLRTDTILNIPNLRPDEYYQGKIEVSDRKSGKTSVQFSFKTKKYFITFNKLFQTSGIHTVEQTFDGGYILGTGNGFIIKLDSVGYEQWRKGFGPLPASNVQVKPLNSGGYIYIDHQKTIRLDNDGNIIWRKEKGYQSIVLTNDNKFVAICTVAGTNGNITGAYFTKFDLNGELIWDKLFGTLYRTTCDFIEKSIDGNYIILGTEGNDDARDFYALKINGIGEILWKKTFPGFGYVFAQQIKPANDNGAIFCGYGVGNMDISNAVVLKIDDLGNLQWNKSFSWGGFKTYANAIEQTKDGGYILTGGAGYSPEKAFLVKLESNGEIKWKNDLLPANYLDYVWQGNDVKQTKDGGYIMVGIKSWTFSGDGKDTGTWVLKTDDFGKL